jgi:hypothetical protein
MNHTIRLYHDKADLVEHASEEIAKQTYVEETGLRDGVVVLGISTDSGALAARTFHNRKPGMPIPGALLQVIGGAAALEFAVDSVGMLDRLNALPMVEGDAFLFLGDGATFHRCLQPVTLDLGLDLNPSEDEDPDRLLATLAQEGELVNVTGVKVTQVSAPELARAAATSEEIVGDGSGERLPDFDPALERTAEGSDTVDTSAPAEGTTDATVAAPEGTTAADTTTEGSDTVDTSAPAEGTTDATVAAPEGTTAADTTTEGSDTVDTSAPAEDSTDATDAAPEGATAVDATAEGSDTTEASAPSQAAPAAPAKKRGR